MDRPRALVCLGCKRPFRKGASIEMMSWSKYQGIRVAPDGREGFEHGPSLLVMWHARCSKKWEGLPGRKTLLSLVESQLRKSRRLVAP